MVPSTLNAEQREAVLHEGSPLLVLAGAGSGKTRVITHRIAHLVRERGVAPWRVLAVTFTNKAAGEMKERLVELIGPDAEELWVATFHATGARILRREGAAIGLSSSFVVYDEAEQLAEMRRVLRAEGLDPKEVDPRWVLHRIDDAKNQGWDPAELAERAYDERSELVARLYERYQKALASSHAVDFGDLLLRLVELFRAAPDVLEKYRGRFQHLLVDEFQDTNRVQYRLMRMLAGEGEGLCVVGDDDQSIYRWRGAEVANLLRFPEDFPGTRLIKLEQNYRSTQRILDAAHAVIEKNPQRMDKRLWTEKEGGAPLELIVAESERDEAAQVAERVRASLRSGVDPAEIAICYRTNAQSRVLEEVFRLGGIPYTVVRGRSFYERAEVKDLAAYLRLAINPYSHADAMRVINRPARGIGAVTVGRIEEAAADWGVSFVQACSQAAQIPSMNRPTQARVRAFADLVGRLALAAAEGSAGEVAEMALRLSGLEDAFLDEGSEDAAERLDNLREFVGSARQWDQEWTPSEDDEGTTPLAAFLEQISLLGDADTSTGRRIALTTLHAAKGLEFEEVYLVGMEEGVFPHGRSLGVEGDEEALAEERRLCYVGFTRAKRRLVLSRATSRVLFGELRFNAPSRFLQDVPRRLFAEGTLGEEVSYDTETIELDESDGFVDDYTIDYAYDQRPVSPKPPKRRRQERVAARGIQVGMPVRHATFGVGMVEAKDGDKVDVRFPAVGRKRVVDRFLEPI